jgi:cytochrome c oxidase subunit 1
MYNDRLAMVQFWLMFVGVSMIFLTQHITGLYGQPRRTFDYVPVQPLIILNQISSVGAWITGIGAGLFLFNIFNSVTRGKPANMDDPFAIGEKYYDYARREPHH